MKMYNLFFIVFFTFCFSGYAQKDSCSCSMIHPVMGYQFLDIYNTYSPDNPYTGICRSFQYDQKEKKVDYDKTWQYGKFVDGVLEYFVQFSFYNSRDTAIVFKRIKKDSVFAEEKHFDYSTGKLQSVSIYYMKGKQPRIKTYGYSVEGFINSESNYFFPLAGDSLNYWGNFHNYKKESVLLPEGFYDIPVKDGPYVEYGGKDGKAIIMKGNYHNNYSVGVWTEWYANGQEKSEGNYIMMNDKTKNGFWEEWYENGQKKSEIDYEYDNPSGKYFEWYENGTSKTSVVYIKFPYFKSYAYFPESDKITYWPNGKMETKEHYENGKMISIEKWFENGHESSAVHYKLSSENWVLLDQTEWYESGALKSQKLPNKKSDGFILKEFFEDSTLEHYSELNKYGFPNGKQYWYYENGKLKSDEVMMIFKKNGECKYYFPSGSINKIENYKYDQKNGNSKIYNEQGILLSDLNYSNNQWNGLCKWYFPNGKLYRECDYTSGLRDSIFTEYNEKEEIVYQQNYKKGIPIGKNKMESHLSSQQKDSLKNLYERDATILSAISISAPYPKFSKYYLDIFPPDSLKEQILSDLISIADFLPTEFDSVRVVHFDSTLRSHVYLDFPYYPKRENDSSFCAGGGSWNPQLDKIISELHFVPVFDECYGDDNGGIRRGFTSDFFFNPYTLDSILKKMNPKYGVEYFGPQNGGQFSDIYNNNSETSIGIFMHGNYTDYSFVLYPYRDGTKRNGEQYNDYLYWTFRIYRDGSFDVLNSGLDTFHFYVPE